MLELETKTIHFVDYSDLERFVHDTYDDKEYEYCPNEECCNGSCKRIEVDGRLSEWNKKDYDSIRQGKVPQYGTYRLFELMCHDGYIQPGTYVVECSW